MDVWAVPCSSCSGLDKDSLMDVRPKHKMNIVLPALVDVNGTCRRGLWPASLVLSPSQSQSPRTEAKHWSNQAAREAAEEGIVFLGLPVDPEPCLIL